MTRRLYVSNRRVGGKLFVRLMGATLGRVSPRLDPRLPEAVDGEIELPWPLFGLVDGALPLDSLALASVLLLDGCLPLDGAAEICLLQPVSDALLAALAEPTAWPMFHWRAHASVPAHEPTVAALRRHGRTPALGRSLGLPEPEVRLSLFGTSRLHRAFARREPDGSVRLQRSESRQPLFAKLGYFHGVREIEQVIALLRGDLEPDPGLLPFAFRVENAWTTPHNEFDEDCIKALRRGHRLPDKVSNTLEEASAVVIEISSLRVNHHPATGLVLHANPNLLHDLGYGELYPQGYYERVMPHLGVRVFQDDEGGVAAALSRLRGLLQPRPLLVLGHLASGTQGRRERREMNALIERACLGAKVEYVDTAPLLDQYGFAQIDGKPDPHHLSPAGEDALGQLLYQRAGMLLRGGSRQGVRLQCAPEPIAPAKRVTWMSLGENCLPDRLLQRHGLKSFSTPFSNGRSNIDQALQLLKNRFADLVEPSLLTYDEVDGQQVVRNRRYPTRVNCFHESVSKTFEFTHHDVIGDPEARESYGRKVRNMLAAGSRGDVLFLYFHRESAASNLAQLASMLEQFAQDFEQPGFSCRVLLMRQQLVDQRSDRRLVHRRVASRVDDFLFRTPAQWGGTDPRSFWAEDDDDLIVRMFRQARLILQRASPGGGVHENAGPPASLPM